MEKRSCGCAARTKEKFNDGLKKDAHAIVAGVEGYSKEDRTKRAAEVKAAFPPVKAMAAAKATTAKTAAPTKAAAMKAAVKK